MKAMTQIGSDLIERVERLQREGFQMLSVEERADLLRMVAQKQRWSQVEKHPAMQRLFLHEMMTPKPVVYSKRSVVENLVVDQTIPITLAGAGFDDSWDTFTNIKSAVAGYTQNDFGTYIVQHFGFSEVDVDDDAEMAKFYNSQYGERTKRLFLTLLVTTLVADPNWKKALVKMLFCMYQSGLLSFWWEAKNGDIMFSPQSDVFWTKFVSAYTSASLFDTLTDFTGILDIYDTSNQILCQIAAWAFAKAMSKFPISGIANFFTGGAQSITNFALGAVQNYVFDFTGFTQGAAILFGFIQDALNYFVTQIRPWLINRGTSKEAVDAIDKLFKSIVDLLASVRIYVFGITYPGDNKTFLTKVSEDTRLMRISSFVVKAQIIIAHSFVGGFFDSMKAYLGSFVPQAGLAPEEIEEAMARSVEARLTEQQKEQCVNQGLGTGSGDTFKLNKRGMNKYGIQDNVDLSTLSDTDIQMYKEKGMIKEEGGVLKTTKAAVDVLTFGTFGVINNEKHYQNMTPSELGWEFVQEMVNTFPEVKFEFYLSVCQIASSLVHLVIHKLPMKWKTPRKLMMYGFVVMFINNVIYSYRRFVSLPNGKYLSKSEVDRRREELKTPVPRAEAEQLVKDAAEKAHKLDKKKHEASRTYADQLKGGLGNLLNWLPGSTIDVNDPSSMFYANNYQYTPEDYETPLKERIEEYTQEKKFTAEQKEELQKFAVDLFKDRNGSEDDGAWQSKEAREGFRRMKYEADGTYVDTEKEDVIDKNVSLEAAKLSVSNLNFPMQMGLQLILAGLMGGLHSCSSDISDSAHKAFNQKCRGFDITVFSVATGTHVIDLGCSTQIDSTDILGRINNKRVPHYICENCANIVRAVGNKQRRIKPNWNVKLKLMDPELNPYFSTSMVALGCRQCKQFSKAEARANDWISNYVNPADKQNLVELEYQWRIVVNTFDKKRNPKTGILQKENEAWLPSLYGLIALDPPAAFIPYSLLKKEQTITEYVNPFDFLQLWTKLLYNYLGVYYKQPESSNAYKDWDRTNYRLVMSIINMYADHRSPFSLEDMKKAVTVTYLEFYDARIFSQFKPLLNNLVKALLKQPYGHDALMTALSRMETKKNV